MRSWGKGVIAALVVAGCGHEPTGADVALTGRVEVTRVAGGLEIANGTDHGIAYTAYNPNWLGLLALCADPGPRCVRVGSRARTFVPESEFQGWADQPAAMRRLNVIWWRVVPSPADGYATADVHEVPVID